MTAKALCVGINEFVNLPTGNWLKGCVNDAEDTAKWLTTQPGFDAGEITILRDGQATKKNIMSALTWVSVSSAVPKWYLTVAVAVSPTTAMFPAPST